MKSAIVRRRKRVGDKYKFLFSFSSCSDAHWGPLAKYDGDGNVDVAKKDLMSRTIAKHVLFKTVYIS